MITNTKLSSNFIKLLLCAVLIFTTSCKESQYKKAFFIAKSDDNNWSTSGLIECDSVDMISEKHAIYWINGHKFNLRGGLIKVSTNPYYHEK